MGQIKYKDMKNENAVALFKNFVLSEKRVPDLNKNDITLAYCIGKDSAQKIGWWSQNWYKMTTKKYLW